MRKLLLSFLLLMAIVSVNAQSTTINLLTDTYSQDFNTLASTGTTGTTLPTNWFSTVTSFKVGNGSISNGGLYSFGDSAVAERSLGSIGSGSATPFFGVKFTNNTTAIITTLNLTYLVELWRLGQKPALRLDSTLLSYNIGVDSLNTAGWINVSSLKMSTPDTNNVGGVAADGGFKLNGNIAPNRKVVSGSITGLSIPIGSTFWLRWSERNVSGADDGLAIDSLRLSFAGSVPVACVAPAAGAFNLVLTPSGNSISGTFAASASATKYLVVRSNSITLSATPVNGTVYAAGASFGGGTVIQSSSSTSFNATGLNGSTLYYFFVFALNDACVGEPFYKTSALSGSASTTCGEPTKPTNLVFTSVTNTTIGGHFTKSVPSAAGYVVVIGKSTNLGYPNDTTIYNVGDSIINGSFKSKVIYVGTDSNFTAIGLDSSTRYYIAVIPYANCPGFINYNRTTPLRDDTLTKGTIIASCFAPDTIVGGVTVGTITNNSIAGSVTPAVNASGYVVVYSKKSFLVAPTDSITYSVGQLITKVNGTFIDSSYVGYVGSSPNFTITGLSPGTKYYFAVIPYANCSYGPNYNVKIANSNKNSATTLGGTPSCNAPDTIIGGVTVGTITTNSIAGSVTPAVNASGYVVVYSKKSFLVAPTDSITYTVGQLITKVNGTFIDSSYVGYVGSSPNFTITGLSPGTKYYFAVIPYASCSYGPNYNVKIANSNKNSATTLGGTPSCNAPDTIIGGVTVGTITTNSIAGSVTPAVNASGYVVVYSKKSFLVAPTDSITYTIGQLITKVNGTFIDSSYVGYVGSSPNFTITGLSPGTKYYFAVIPYSSCSYGPNYNIKIANSNKNSATTLLTTGIRNNTNQIAIKLFPNPTTNILNVEFEKNNIGNTNVTILDNVGRVVFANSYSLNNQLQINLPSLAKGIYIINLENKDFTAVKTFIVE